MRFASIALALLVPSAILAQSADNLVTIARSQPDSLRKDFSRALSAAASSRPAVEQARHIRLALRLASSYAEAWSDSFLVRRAGRFESLSPDRRRAFVSADSLRLAGNDALGAQGIPAAMKLWRAALINAASTGMQDAVAPVLVSIGGGFYRLGEFDSAAVYLKRGHDIARSFGDWRTQGNAAGVLASVQKDLGDYDTAAKEYRRAIEIRRKSGDNRGIAADENNLAELAQIRGDIGAARASYERALSINRKDNRQALVALNLSNLGTLARSIGDYARADSLYRASMRIHSVLGDTAEAAFVQHELGRLFIMRGDYALARLALESALRLHRASQAEVEQARVLLDLAAVQAARGNPEEARKILDYATRLVARTEGSAAITALLAVSRGDLAVQFGALSDADVEYRRAASAFENDADSVGLAQVLDGRATLLHWKGDDARAIDLLSRSTRISHARGDRRSAAITALLAAEVHRARGDIRSSRQALMSARETFRQLGDAVGEAAAVTSLADAALDAGDHRAAETLYRRGLTLVGTREASDVRQRLHSGLGEVFRRQGLLANAAASYRRAIDETERAAATFRLQERRSAFLADKWHVYSQLALVEQRRGNSAEAFAVSERMRAGQLRDLLARGRIPRRARASQQEQDLRRRISFLAQRLESGRGERTGRDPDLPIPSRETATDELASAQRAYGSLLSQLRESDPAYESIVTGRVRSWKEVAARLAPDEIFLEYMLADSASTVFAITKDTVAAIDLRATRETVRDVVEFAHRTIEGSTNASGRDLWRAPLQRLHSLLINPLDRAGYLRGKKTLIVAPHAELHFASFASLLGGASARQFLVDRFDIAYTPSATVWVELGTRGAAQAARRIAAFAPNVKRLPGSRREAETIGRIYGRDANVLLGRDATPGALRQSLARAGVIHLATFGVLNRHNPLFSFVELAPSSGDDGRLDVVDVFGLPLSGQLVVLSACQTALASGALADVPPGDDWVGLVQAFLQAGARSVVATLWPVDDMATARLMQEFHQHLSSRASPAAALARAQRALIRQASTSRPVYWAGFTLNGSPH